MDGSDQLEEVSDCPENASKVVELGDEKSAGPVVTIEDSPQPSQTPPVDPAPDKLASLRAELARLNSEIEKKMNGKPCNSNCLENYFLVGDLLHFASVKKIIASPCPGKPAPAPPTAHDAQDQLFNSCRLYPHRLKTLESLDILYANALYRRQFPMSSTRL